jgi:hypothetical protein
MQSAETVDEHLHTAASPSHTSSDQVHKPLLGDNPQQTKQNVAGGAEGPSCIQLSDILSPGQQHQEEEEHIPHDEDASALQDERLLDSDILNGVCDVGAALPSADTPGVGCTAEVSCAQEPMASAPPQEKYSETDVHSTPDAHAADTVEREQLGKENLDPRDDVIIRMQSFVHDLTVADENSDDEYSQFEKEISSIQQRFAECELQDEQQQQQRKALLTGTGVASEVPAPAAADEKGSSFSSDEDSSLDMYSSAVLNHAYGKMQGLAPKRMVEQMKLAVQEVPEVIVHARWTRTQARAQRTCTCTRIFIQRGVTE